MSQASTVNSHQWIVSDPVFTAGKPGTFDEVSVKDPSIVRVGNRWHVFYTSKGRTASGVSTSSVGYVSAENLRSLNQSPRIELKQQCAPIVAPQVFFYEPHQLWYLIAQVGMPSTCNFHATYLTNKDISDPHGWSAPEVFTFQRRKPVFWIDFWIICDQTHAHLFYTDHDGRLFRQQAPLNKFPYGFGPEELAVDVRGTDSRGPWRLHEASHIYKVKSTGTYLALLEAVRPHPTRKNYWDSRSRFMFAMEAEKLYGPWRRIESSDDQFWGDPQNLLRADGSRHPYGQVSHPEAIRSGSNQLIEIDDMQPELFFQAFDASKMGTDYDYDFLPWELALASKPR